VPHVRRQATLAGLAWLLLPLATVSCYSLAEPSLRPGDSRDVMAALARQGVVVSEVAVGEPGCDDPDLVENALHLTAATGADPEPRDVFLYLFRARGWEASAAAVDACQAAYARTKAGASMSRVDVPTYRAFGADWSEELTLAIGDALREASTMGA
jgi:hypothetical protein